MAKKLKIVIDTNVFISGLLGRGSAYLVYKTFLSKKFKLVLTPSLLKEIKLVLNRPKLRIEKNKIERLLKLLKSQAIIVKPKIKIKECRDEADNIILSCAIHSKANFIITWDKDLLTLSNFRGIPILTPSDFLKVLFK